MSPEERDAFKEYVDAIVAVKVIEAVGKIDRDSLRGPAGEKGERGDKGEPGEPGKDGAPGRTGERGDKGEPGERGGPGEVGPAGKAGDPGPPGERGEKGMDGKDGREGKDGLHGKDGRDGVATKDEILAIAKGLLDKLVPEIREELKALNAAEVAKLPVMRFAGVYRGEQVYTPGQTVQFGGDMWHCNVETKEKPGGNDDWTLVVRKGRDLRPPDRKG